jgi:hypothetical protein
MTYEAGNVEYAALSSDVSLAVVAGEVRRPHRVEKKEWRKAKAISKARVAALVQEAKARDKAARAAAKAAKPKVAKVAKAKAVKPVAELSEKAAAMLAELRRIADAEGRISVASISLAGVSGRSIGALLSVLARRSLYTKGAKGRGVVKMPA